MARITLRQLLDHAAERGFGVPACNVDNMEPGRAIMAAAQAVDAPVILQLDPAIATKLAARWKNPKGT